MHKIILHRNAFKFYRKADDALKERVTDAIDVIARNPYLDRHIKKLKGDLHAWLPYGRSGYPFQDRRCVRDSVDQDHRMERNGLQIKVHPADAAFLVVNHSAILAEIQTFKKTQIPPIIPPIMPQFIPYSVIYLDHQNFNFVFA